MKTTEEKRERYVANNRRNRDVYSRAIAANQLSFLNDVKQEINLEEMSDVEEIEDLANIKKS